MDAAEMVKQLTTRRDSIRELLPKLTQELEQIDAKVRELEDLLGKGYTLDVPIPPELAHSLQDNPETRAKEARIPLAQRRLALLHFLAKNGPSTRTQILAGTGIPAGSLSALLADPEIVSAGHGIWRLRGTPDTPHEDE